ncbi:MAG TPA: hypothetical protein PLP48_00080 [Acholeplasmataceae bacterium]|nr:hypothetical protein [Acholeplasmataceae bacterium]
MKITIFDLSKHFNVTVIGDNVELDGINLVDRQSIKKSILSYVTSIKYIDSVNNNISIKCLALNSDMYEYYKSKLNRKLTFLITDNPESFFYSSYEFLLKNNFVSIIEFSKKIGENTIISPTAIIEDSVIIGNNCTIGDYSIISKNTIIGNDVYIGRGVKIGSQGFQIVKSLSGPQTIYHIGGVKIGNNVYIGDNSVVSRNLFEGYNTIGDNVKIDSLCSISHNCEIGNNSILAAGVQMCGSSIIKENCWIGTNSTILNKVVIGANALIGIGSVVVKNIEENKVVYGVAASVKRDI